MNIALINLSGNVGKSTLAVHLFAAMRPGAKIISVESVNSSDADTIQGIEVEEIEASSFREIFRELMMAEGDVILDVGALVRSARPAPDMPAPVVVPESTQPLALVVDDSITMRRVTQRLLERNGFRVLTAKDGVEAVSVLQDHRPDIILLDVEMPRMDGYEFARHVRNNADTVNVPIIMVTSRVSEKHRARAIEIGVNDYLGKPYHERELMEAVQQQLASV